MQIAILRGVKGGRDLYLLVLWLALSMFFYPVSISLPDRQCPHFTDEAKIWTIVEQVWLL